MAGVDSVPGPECVQHRQGQRGETTAALQVLHTSDMSALTCCSFLTQWVQISKSYQPADRPSYWESLH